MASRVIPQHKFVSSPSKPTSRCGAMVGSGRGSKLCWQPPDHSCHRFYRCERGCRLEFPSWESRDTHHTKDHS